MREAGDPGGVRIRVQIQQRYPAQFGLPETVHPEQFILSEGFARTADQARRKILDLVERGQTFELDGVGTDAPREFRPERVVLVATWEEEV